MRIDDDVGRTADRSIMQPMFTSKNAILIHGDATIT
jgi:hypothetical protein